MAYKSVFYIPPVPQTSINMQSSIVLLACGIFSLGLSLAKSSSQRDEHHLIHRSHSADATPDLSLKARGFVFSGGSFAREIQSFSQDGSSGASLGGTLVGTGFDQANNAPSQASSQTPSQAPSQAIASASSYSAQSATSSAPSVPSAPTCDKTNTKSEINRMLVECECKLQTSSAPIIAYTSQVNQESAQQLASQIVLKLKDILSQLKLSLSNVQLCGMDPKPLSTNKGVALSDVSWSAFQVVLTLKAVFESITCLYKPFPVIKTLCSDTLLSISTALANLIGACGEQINLFDTRFFPLVSPQLEEFTNLGDNFVSFVGTFAS